MTTRRVCDGRKGDDGWTGCPHDSEAGERLDWGWVLTWDREADLFRHSCPLCLGHTAEEIAKAAKRKKRKR